MYPCPLPSLVTLHCTMYIGQESLLRKQSGACHKQLAQMGRKSEARILHIWAHIWGIFGLISGAYFGSFLASFSYGNSQADAWSRHHIWAGYLGQNTAYWYHIQSRGIESLLKCFSKKSKNILSFIVYIQHSLNLYSLALKPWASLILVDGAGQQLKTKFHLACSLETVISKPAWPMCFSSPCFFFFNQKRKLDCSRMLQ